MKALIYTILTALFLSILIGCSAKLPLYIPVESEKAKKEYIDRWHRDSIYIKDSIIIRKKGDTVFVEKYKNVYKDRLVRDSIYIVNSIKIAVPYPVEVVNEVNRLNDWQIILMMLGGVLVGYVGFRIVGWIKKFV